MRAVFFSKRMLAPRRLPGAAAAVAGDDAAPAAGTVNCRPAGRRRWRARRRPNRHGDAAAAADRAGDTAAAGRRDPGAAHQEGYAVARAAIAPGGGEDRGPGAVIGARPSGRVGGAGHGERRNAPRRQGGIGTRECAGERRNIGKSWEICSFSCCPGNLPSNDDSPFVTADRFRGSSLPICLSSAISPTFIARLIKGCRGDDRAGCFISEIT